MCEGTRRKASGCKTLVEGEGWRGRETPVLVTPPGEQPPAGRLGLSSARGWRLRGPGGPSCRAGPRRWAEPRRGGASAVGGASSWSPARGSATARGAGGGGEARGADRGRFLRRQQPRGSLRAAPPSLRPHRPGAGGAGAERSRIDLQPARPRRQQPGAPVVTRGAWGWREAPRREGPDPCDRPPGAPGPKAPARVTGNLGPGTHLRDMSTSSESSKTQASISKFRPNFPFTNGETEARGGEAARPGHRARLQQRSPR